MKYILRLVAGLSFLLFATVASSTGNGSLEELLAVARKADKSSACLDVCFYLVENGEVSESFSEYLEKGYRMALREKNAESIARYYDCKAEYDMLQGNLSHYMEYKAKAYSIYGKLGKNAAQANCCIYIGNYYNAIGEYDSARIYLYLMQPYAKQHVAESSYHIMLSCLADTYYRMGEKDSAIHYEKMSVEASTELRDSFYLSGSYRALGMYYRTLGNMDSSLAYYGKALDLSLLQEKRTSSEMEELTALYINLAVLCIDMKRRVEVRNYLAKAIETVRDVNNEIFLAQVYSNIGCIYQREGEDEAADLYLKCALVLAEKLGVNDNYLRTLSYYIMLQKDREYAVDSVRRYIRKAEERVPLVRAVMPKVSYFQALMKWLMKEKDYAGALRVADRILRQEGVQSSNFVLQELYANSRVCHYRLGNYKVAYEDFDRQVALRDSMNDSQKSKELQELAVKYQAKEKELEIVELNARKARDEQKAKLRILILVSCLVVSSLIFLYAVQRQKTRAERLKRAVEEKEREFAVLKKESELRLVRKYIDGLETERSRLAKELHDGVSNNLLVLETRLKKLLAEKDVSVFSFLSETREDVRNISHELMPPVFRYATIDEMLWDYVSHLVDSSQVQLKYYSDPSEVDWSIVPENIGYEVYRIVQEALNNSLKHASATSVTVSMELDGVILTICIMDNGIGFNPSSKHSGIGIQTMRERASVVGGELNIESNEAGTKVKLVVGILNASIRK